MTRNGIKQQIVRSLDHVPEETLPEVMTFLEYLQYRQTHRESDRPPYEPIALGGLWTGVEISEEDIATVRREMVNATYFASSDKVR